MLVSIPSLSNGDIRNLEIVLDLVKDELSGFSYKEFHSNEKPSLLFYNTPTVPKKFKVLLNCHLDVVQAEKQFFHPYEQDGKLFGHGTFDMKAGSAAVILLYKHLAKKLKFPIGLQLVTDEEIGGYDGTKHQIDQGVRADFVIAADASNFEIVQKTKGFAWMKVTAKGTTSHGAYPWEGENAIWKIHHFLECLEKTFPIPEKPTWATTINLAKIETSNFTFNNIPADCTAWLDIRYIPEDKDIIRKKILDLFGKNFTYELVLNESYAHVDKENSYVQKLQQASELATGKKAEITIRHAGSDVRFFSEIGIAGVEFGVKGGRLPEGNEWVDIKGLKEYYDTLKTFLLSLQEKI